MLITELKLVEVSHINEQYASTKRRKYTHCINACPQGCNARGLKGTEPYVDAKNRQISTLLLFSRHFMQELTL